MNVLDAGNLSFWLFLNMELQIFCKTGTSVFKKGPADWVVGGEKVEW